MYRDYRYKMFENSIKGTALGWRVMARDAAGDVEHGDSSTKV